MSQVTTGVRAVLSHPLLYDALQKIMGAEAIRRDLVENFILSRPANRILDIGCGTSEVLHHLPEGLEYWGYDISQDYIDAARRRFGKRGHFHCGLLTREDLARLPKFDAVIAIGVLHHLDDQVALNLFSLAREALAEGGRLITIDPCLAPGQNPIARYLILHDRGQNVRTQAGYRDLVAHSFARVDGTLRHRSWIPYTHWIMECAA